MAVVAPDTAETKVVSASSSLTIRLDFVLREIILHADFVLASAHTHFGISLTARSARRIRG